MKGSLGNCGARVAKALALACVTVLLMGPASAETPWARCANGDVRISGVSGEELSTACETVERTVAFLQSAGLSRIPRIEVSVVDAIPLDMPNAIGCYDSRSHSIYLLTRAVCDERWAQDEFFRVPNDAGIYWSFLSHEVAHSVASANFRAARPSVTAQEYIAAVAQLSLMDEVRKTEILRQFSGKGFVNEEEVSLLIYQMDPAYFMVQSYRHYLRPENGPAFVGKLLTGEITLSDRLAE